MSPIYYHNFETGEVEEVIIKDKNWKLIGILSTVAIVLGLIICRILVY